MHFKYLSNLSIVITMLVFATMVVEARRVILRPLPPKEIFAVLKEARENDDVPESRIVTQTIAALSGLALGIAKGVGGALIFDLATSNATTEWLNSMNVSSFTFNTTGLFGSSTSSSSSTKLESQEVCFGGRSLEPEATGRQVQPHIFISQTGTGSGTGTGSAAVTTPTATGTATGTAGTQASGFSGNGLFGGTGTGDETCIVVQKPQTSRRRRRSHLGNVPRKHLKKSLARIES